MAEVLKGEWEQKGPERNPAADMHSLWPIVRVWLLSVVRWEDIGGFRAKDIMIQLQF